MPSNATIRAKVQRWQDDPEGETSISAQIARRLWAGEVVNPRRMSTELNCSPSMPGVVVKELRQVGWVIATEPDPEKPDGLSVVYRVTGQGPELPERVVTRRLVGIQPKRAPSKITPTKLPPVRQQVAATQYPPLGASLTVKALALTDDGTMVQLSDGNGHAWQAVITGHVG